MSRQQERRLAEQTGGHVQKASGATDFAKGDVQTAGELYEAKTTAAKSFILHRSVLTKLEAEAALGRLRMPVLQLQFEGQAGLHRRYAVLPWELFQQLMEKP